MNRTTLIATIALTALAPIIWGSTFIVTTQLLPDNSPLSASTLRALPAGLLLVLFSRMLPTGIWWSRLMILGFLNIGLFFYCLFFAATYLPGGMAALVMSGQPILVMLFSYLFLNSQLNIKHIFASFLAIASIAMLVLNNNAALNVNGILMGLLGTVSMAVGVLLTKQWGRPDGMTLLNFTGWQLLFGGLALLPVALLMEGIPSDLTIENILGYSYLSVFGAIIAYSLWFYGIDKLPTITVSFLGFISSISAVFFGYVFLGEALTWLQWFGVLGILIAIALASSKVTKRRKAVQELVLSLN